MKNFGMQKELWTYRCITCEEWFCQKEEKGKNIIPLCKECSKLKTIDKNGKPIDSEVIKLIKKAMLRAER